MQILKYTNDRGESITFGSSGPFILTTVEGLGGADAEIYKTRSPYQDGSSISRVAINDRMITLRGAVIAKNQEEMYRLRRQLARVLNPQAGGKLVYKNDFKSYTIGAIADEGPIWGERHVSHQLFNVSFLCPDPFLLDEFEESQVIATWIGGMTFPLVLPTIFAESGPKTINIVNNGDVDTPIRCEFRGPAGNPRLTNRTTGEYIQINRRLLASDKLIVTTEFGNKRVEVEDAAGNRTNVLYWIDYGSSFWWLKVGDNIVSYTSDDEVEPASVIISYRNRYNGA
ncbi:distal tail protein Dit [Paenibacillus alvei]|uniref:Phage tail family protein n=1 Tax=Paenibacillus alvei TaxID=44250 RepID=A0AAP7DKQ4_PAEAL|nr:phage tail family protein [Paenibacillus alvei]